MYWNLYLLTLNFSPRTQSVNVKGIFNCCQAVLPYMLEQNYGRIVNIASIAGEFNTCSPLLCYALPSLLQVL